MSPLSGDDLRVLVYRSVQLCLEVTAGRRPPASLDRIVTADVGLWLRNNVATGDPRPARIRRLAIQYDDDRIDVTALVAAEDQQVSAVTLRLQAVGPRWQITAVEHLHRGRHLRHTVNDRPPPSDRHLNPEPDGAAQAALRSVAKASEQRALAATTWADRAAHRADARRWRARADSMAPDPQPPSHRPAAYVVALLGAPPQGGSALTAWTHAAATIANYRRTWNITDARLPLGVPPPDTAEHAHQRTHREHTIAVIRTLLAQFRTRDVGQQPPALEPPVL